MAEARNEGLRIRGEVEVSIDLFYLCRCFAVCANYDPVMPYAATLFNAALLKQKHLHSTLIGITWHSPQVQPIPDM